MHFADIARLLDPAPMPLEMGYERLDDGVLHVAIRTDMPGCTGAMLEWWFGQRIGTREYRWWHPIDHISSAWIDGEKGQVVGATHLVEECFSGSPPESLSIQFRDPGEAFDAAALHAARASGAVSAVLLARGGMGHDARRDPEGRVIGTRLVHLCRDTGWGMVLRSHFFMGYDLPALGMPRAVMEQTFPEIAAVGLLQHCYDEFSMLSQILPALYRAEGGVEASRHW